jgi:TatD DNase family protein
MYLIDTHAHIYLPEFETDRGEMLKRAENELITSILMPAIDSSTHFTMLQAEENYSAICRSMMGLHPCSVKKNYKEELKIVRDYLDKRKFIAIGETGLDYYWDLTYREEQIKAFRQQIEWAIEFEIPVVIHSRNSTQDCIELIGEYQKGKLKGVFHCFSGTPDEAQQIIDLGFYLGIGGVVTFKNSGLNKVMEKVEIGKIVLETDAPYLAPVPYRGKRNECSYLKYVVQKLAEIKNIKAEEIAFITTQNARKLFELLNT